MSRVLRSKLPVAKELLTAKAHSAASDLEARQQVQKNCYDRHAKDLKPLQSDDAIRVNHNGDWKSGIVMEKYNTPRSYVIKTEDGSILQRNRRHLIHTDERLPLCQPHSEEDWRMPESYGSDAVQSQPHCEEDWQSQPRSEEDWRMSESCGSDAICSIKILYSF